MPDETAKAYDLELSDHGKAAAHRRGITLKAWREQCDAAAHELYTAMRMIGGVDSNKDPFSHEFSGYRYTLALPHGGVLMVGNVSLSDGAVRTRFDSAATLKAHDLYSEYRLPGSVNPISCKWNHEGDDPAQNVKAILDVLSRFYKSLTL